MKSFGLIAALAALAFLGSCASKPELASPEPRPRPLPVSAPRPAPPPPAALDWRDLPLTPGSWRYEDGAAGPEAVFGAAGAASFAVRCDRSRRLVTLSREGAGAPTPLVVRTSSGDRSFPAASAALPASDRFLDAVAFSRGRFTAESAGLPTLVIPAWPEPARVVEDCRT